MGTELDYDDIDSICLFKSKKYRKPAEKNKHGQRVCFLLRAAEFFALSNPNLSRSYVKELVEVCEKHLIRLKPDVKRKFCKGCNTFLVYGVNSLVRVPGDPGDSTAEPGTEGSGSRRDPLVAVTCLVCTRTRRHRPPDGDKSR